MEVTDGFGYPVHSLGANQTNEARHTSNYEASFDNSWVWFFAMQFLGLIFAKVVCALHTTIDA
jgi:hypothetical protein